MEETTGHVAAAATGGQSRGGSRVKVQRTQEEIIERKVKMAENVSSLVIAPKTREGHILVKTLFGFDRAVNQIRMKAGTFLVMKDAMEWLNKANSPVKSIDAIAKGLGGASGATSNVYSYAGREGASEKLMLARRKTTYVFLPRTEEGRLIAEGIKKLDPLLLEFRTKCTDFTQATTVFKDILSLVSDFNKVTEGLAVFAGTKYESPKMGGLQDAPASKTK